MENFLPEMPVRERLVLLRDNADKVEQTTYQKPLTVEDLDVKREQLTENCIALSEFEDEKKEAMAVFKEKMDPLSKQNKLLLTQIKTKQETVEGTLFHHADHDKNVMNTYDEQGEFVSSRRLRPEEKQARLFVSKSTH